MSLLYLTLFLLLRVLLRNAWLAGAVFAVAASASSVGMLTAWGGRPHVVDWLMLLVLLGLIVLLASRFGLLALVGALVPQSFALFYPAPSYDLSAWTAGSLLVPPVVLLAVAVWGFRTSLAGQPLLSDEAA
jgi:hypothetical protein